MTTTKFDKTTYARLGLARRAAAHFTDHPESVTFCDAAAGGVPIGGETIAMRVPSPEDSKLKILTFELPHDAVLFEDLEVRQQQEETSKDAVTMPIQLPSQVAIAYRTIRANFVNTAEFQSRVTLGLEDERLDEYIDAFAKIFDHAEATLGFSCMPANMVDSRNLVMERKEHISRQSTKIPSNHSVEKNTKPVETHYPVEARYALHFRWPFDDGPFHVCSGITTGGRIRRLEMKRKHDFEILEISVDQRKIVRSATHHNVRHDEFIVVPAADKESYHIFVGPANCKISLDDGSFLEMKLRYVGPMPAQPLEMAVVVCPDETTAAS